MRLVLAAAFALLGTTALAEPPQPSNPPLITVPWSSLNPDIVAVLSTDPSAGATAVTVVDPLPAVPQMMLHIDSPQTGPVNVWHDIQPGDTKEIVAHDLCDKINAHNVLKMGNIACQFQGLTIIGITNFTTNRATVTAYTGGFVVNRGSPAWDAGPIFALLRKPGPPPPPWSSVGQVLWGARAVEGQDVQYGMMQCMAMNAVSAAIEGACSIFTAENQNGATSIGERIMFRHGVQICVGSVCGWDYGDGSFSIPATAPDGSGPGLFLGGRKVCIAPSGDPVHSNYLYVAEGSACPPGG